MPYDYWILPNELTDLCDLGTEVVKIERGKQVHNLDAGVADGPYRTFAKARAAHAAKLDEHARLARQQAQRARRARQENVDVFDVEDEADDDEE